MNVERNSRTGVLHEINGYGVVCVGVCMCVCLNVCVHAGVVLKAGVQGHMCKHVLCLCKHTTQVSRFHERQSRGHNKDDRSKRLDALKANDFQAYQDMLRQQGKDVSSERYGGVLFGVLAVAAITNPIPPTCTHTHTASHISLLHIQV